MVFLKNELSVYVPSNVAGEVNKNLQAHWVQTFQRMFCENFGGCTTTKAEGCWVGADGKIITEEIVIVTVNYSSTNYGVSQKTLNMILDMKKSMLQEGVSYKNNGVLIIV